MLQNWKQTCLETETEFLKLLYGLQIQYLVELSTYYI